MGTKKTINAEEVFPAYLKHIKKGNTKLRAAELCGVSRHYADRNFTASQKAEIEIEFNAHKFKGMTNKPK